MTPILVLLINSYTWRNALVIAGIGTMVIGLPLSLVVRHRPEQYGYLPDDDKPGDRVYLSADSGGVEAGRDLAAEEGFSVKQCLRTRTFWMLLLFTFFPGFAMSAIIVHEMPYLISVGISENMAAMTMVGITGCSLIGRLGFAWLGDIYDKRRLMAIAVAVQTIGVFIFASISSPWMIIPFLLTFGPGYGAPIPLMGAIQADYFGTKAFGSLRGLFSIGYALPGIVAPFFAGWIYDVQGSYRLAFYIFAGLCIFAIPAILSLRPVQSKQPKSISGDIR